MTGLDLGRSGGSTAVGHVSVRWAVVDLETTGLSPASCRVISISVLALRPDGSIEDQLVTLLDPGCDPGPVHIHGITRAMLSGAPHFADIYPQLRALLAGRVLVAHNASFEFEFLSAEAELISEVLPTERRLCTLTLSRRLDLGLSTYTLESVAAYWGVEIGRPHVAFDDSLAARDVLLKSVAEAEHLNLRLPLVDCGPASRWPTRIPRVACPWANPGRWQEGRPLVRGMRVVITGPTSLSRAVLARRLVLEGLDYVESVSGQTSVIVRNSAGWRSRKVERAEALGVPSVDEARLLNLLRSVALGRPRARRAARDEHRVTVDLAPDDRRALPYAGHRVLVVGGSHDEAASARAAAVRLGASAAINFSTGVTDVLVLPGGLQDPRVDRGRKRGLTIHVGALDAVADVDGSGPSPAIPQRPARATTYGASVVRPHSPHVLSRGAVIDLPAGRRWSITAAWRADAAASGIEVDMVAFLLCSDDRVDTDLDFVFYNQPVSDDGAVALSLDGDSEQRITIDLDELSPSCVRVVIAAALSGEHTFGDLGAVAVAAASDEAVAVTATLDAGTTERSVVLAEVYLRRDRWRFRAVGQGYDDGLASLAVRFGVDVER